MSNRLLLLQSKLEDLGKLSNAEIAKGTLSTFVDAGGQPMPRMMRNLDWAEVKKRIITTVKNFKFE